ncbi:hypothetical protein V8F20_005304 [Naviculisporaceae sp. PSN 640]
MATSGSVFSETLNEITITKLQELSKRRAAFEEAKAAALRSAQDQGTDAIQRLTILNQGVKKCFAIKDTKHVGLGTNIASQIETDLHNIERFVAQARNDPSVSHAAQAEWEQRLRRHLDNQSLKYDYASLCAQLVNEWLSGDSGDDGGDVEMQEGDDFEQVDKSAKIRSRIQWETSVFEPAKVNVPRLEKYLENLFGVPANGKSKPEPERQSVFKALGKLRSDVEEHERSLLLSGQFNNKTLGWAIQGLLSSSLLSNEKREVLKDFAGNPMILKEVADVLNMRMAALESWSWGSGGVAMEQKRMINGAYNMHMHEDLLQAIFLQYIGVKWSTFFKGSLKHRFFAKTNVWKKSRSRISQNSIRRLGYYLGAGEVHKWPSVQTSRRRIYRKGYTLSQLLAHPEDEREDIDGEEEVEYVQFASDSQDRKRAAPRKQLASKAARKSAPSMGEIPGMGRGGAKRHRRVLPDSSLHSLEDQNSDSNESEYEYNDHADEIPKSRMQLRQKLLHLFSSDLTLVKTRSDGELTAVHSTFEDWNPRLPHQTVLTILKFFGVSDTWLAFFTRFLEAPLKLVGDNDNTEPRIRRRGAPESHVLSDVFGEVTLFCLDFAVNQVTCGQHLWRVFDDMWFWSQDHSVAVQAWKTIQDFALVTSTTTNPAKTGTVRISSNPDTTLGIDKSLPEGQIRWGFLKLSPQTGRFEIDNNLVDHHIDELRTQLQSAKNIKSIFSFIQTWNTYVSTFFTSNFGKPANCLGREHVDQMLAAHGRIQREVFAKMGDGSVSSVVDHIKEILGRRFGIKDVPDGFLFFPVEMGGLELKSPFIPLLLLHHNEDLSVEALTKQFEEDQWAAYERMKARFLAGVIANEREDLDEPNWEPEDPQDRVNFMSFDEFTRYRDELNFRAFEVEIHGTFEDLMGSPVQRGVGVDAVRVGPAVEKLKGQPDLQSISWQRTDLYWSWITMMYGPEVVERFGGLNIVDPGLLPMGMVSLLRERKVTWQE